jgi:hypothetical protein
VVPVFRVRGKLRKGLNMGTSQYDALEARIAYQQKQIDDLKNELEFLKQKLPAYCTRCRAPIPTPAFGPR